MDSTVIQGVIAVVGAAAAGAGYYFYRQHQEAKDANQELLLKGSDTEAPLQVDVVESKSDEKTPLLAQRQSKVRAAVQDIESQARESSTKEKNFSSPARSTSLKPVSPAVRYSSVSGFEERVPKSVQLDDPELGKENRASIPPHDRSVSSGESSTRLKTNSADGSTRSKTEESNLNKTSSVDVPLGSDVQPTPVVQTKKQPTPKAQSEAETTAAFSPSRDALKKRKEKKEVEISKVEFSPEQQTALKEFDEKMEAIQVPKDEEIEALFIEIDTNENGVLSLKEVDDAIIKRKFGALTPTVVLRAFEKVDLNRDGTIGRKEFNRFMQCITYFKNLWNVFVLIDKDDNRRLDRDEFFSAAAILEVANPIEVYEEMTENQNNYITFDEFCFYMAAHGYLARFEGAEVAFETPIAETPENDVPTTSSSSAADEKSEATDATPVTKVSAVPSKPPPSTEAPQTPEFDLTAEQEAALKEFEEKVESLEVFMPGVEEIHTLFEEVDTDGDGFLSLKEVEKAVIKRIFDLTPTVVLRAFEKVDWDHNGKIGRGEFQRFMQFITYFRNLWNVFALIDKDGNRRLSKNEFYAAAAILKVSNPCELFEEMDESQLGYIVFDVFCMYMAEHKFLADRFEVADAVFETAPSSTEPPPDVASGTAAATAELAVETANENIKTAVQTSVEEAEALAQKVTREDQEAALKEFEEKVETIFVPQDEEINTLFEEIDTNEDGRLSLKEVEDAVIKRKFDSLTLNVVLRAFEKVDLDHSGHIGRDEFFSFMKSITYFRNLWNVFLFIDKDGNRRLDKKEFFTGAAILKVADPQEVFDEMDPSQSGYIFFDTFCLYMAEHKYNKGAFE